MCDSISLSSRHPGDGAVRQFAGEPQHARCQSRHQNGKRIGIRHLQLCLNVVDIAAEVYPPLADQGSQHRQILLHVLRGAVIRQAHYALNQRAVGQADAQSQPAIAGALGGEGMLCHAQRVKRVGRNDRRAEFDAACLLADDREGR